ncbi:MAG: ATP/GTP-binding protein [Pseudomonadota bacterium]
MNPLKIVFTGPVGSGKTSAVETISEVPVVQTEVVPTDTLKNNKSLTTTAMDYGELTIDTNQTLALYGTPGQTRFAYMWDILSKDALGIILLVSNKRRKPIDDLCFYINHFKYQIESSTAAFGVTHLDSFENPQYEMEKYYAFFDKNRYSFPLFPVDTRQRYHVKVLIESLLSMLEIGD